MLDFRCDRLALCSALSLVTDDTILEHSASPTSILACSLMASSWQANLLLCIEMPQRIGTRFHNLLFTMQTMHQVHSACALLNCGLKAWQPERGALSAGGDHLQ